MNFFISYFLVLSFFIPLINSQTTISHGIPPSINNIKGIDFCKGQIPLMCKQSYVLHPEFIPSISFSQFSMNIRDVSSSDSNTGTALLACITESKFDSWIKEQITNYPDLFVNNSNSMSSFPLTSNMWEGYQVQGMVTNVNSFYQSSIQVNFIQFVNSHQTYGCKIAGATVNAILPIIIIGVIGGIILLILVVYTFGREELNRCCWSVRDCIESIWKFIVDCYTYLCSFCCNFYYEKKRKERQEKRAQLYLEQEHKEIFKDASAYKEVVDEMIEMNQVVDPL